MSPGIQNIIVYIIGILVALLIGFRIYRLITGKRDPCASCGRECTLRSELTSLRKAKQPKGKKLIAAKRKELSDKSRICDNGKGKGCGCGS